MVHGWRLDPILLFSQVLIIVTVLVAGWENRLRGLIANMAKLKRKKKIVFFLLNIILVSSL
jgi:Tfp pilus assembly protein PilO